MYILYCCDIFIIKPSQSLIGIISNLYDKVSIR